MEYDTEAAVLPAFFTPVSLNGFAKRNIRQILVVSDLHLSEGFSTDTFHWNRRENFLADSAFSRFLETKRKEARHRNSQLWLIINGDFIDFVRITATPTDEAELREWQEKLTSITEAKLPGQKQRVLNAFEKFAKVWRIYLRVRHQPSRKWPRAVRHEVKYGLKTQDFKSIYRLIIAQQGHRQVFQALAQWLAEGHRLTIISGNHDHELNQDLVQAGLRWVLEDIYQAMQKAKRTKLASAVAVDSSEALDFQTFEPDANGNNRNRGFEWHPLAPDSWSDTAHETSFPPPDFSQSLTFEKHGLEIDGTIRIEHGHRFEWKTQTSEKWHDPKHQELMLAPGSLFNRYLINRLEHEIPHLDNVKPSTLVIGYLAKHHPLRFLKMLGKLMTTTFQLARKRGPRKLIRAGLLKTAQLALPSIYFLWALLILFCYGNGAWLQIWHGPGFGGMTFPFYAAVPFFVLCYWGIAQALKKLKLDFSVEEAKAQMRWPGLAANDAKTRYAIYGHTHEAVKQRWDDNLIHLNSGTWTPVFEYESGLVRDDLTMTFVELTKNNAGIWKGELLRWAPIINVATEVVLTEPRQKVS
jgi:UDP-2,3-diacylglucosamine pyrophosphatase LpxH